MRIFILEYSYNKNQDIKPILFKTINGGESWTKILSNRVHLYYGFGYSNPFNSLCFLDQNIGFVYDNSGKSNIIFSTIDGGESWKCVSVSYPKNVSGKNVTIFSDLKKILFPSYSDTGYIVNGADLYKTVDMGNTWSKIYESNSNSELETVFVNNQVGYLPREKLFTRDGGLTWLESQ